MIIPKEHGEGREGHKHHRETRERLTKQEREERKAERAAKKEPVEVAVHHTKAIAVGMLIMAGAIGIPLGLYYGIGYLNPGASWSPYYQAPAPAPTTPATYPFVHPDFVDGSTTLLPQDVWVGLYEQRNDTLAWVETYEGSAMGIPTTAVNPPVGAAYTYTQPGFIFFGGSDSGSFTNGAFGDGKVRTFPLSGAFLNNTGHTIVPAYETRSVAAAVTVRAIKNNTVTVISAGNPLKAANAAASNLSISIAPSQAQIDALAKWVPYYDLVNASMTGVYITYTGNWTTAALGNTYLDVYANGVKITPTAVIGSTALSYMLPGTLGQSGATINAYWTHAGVAANAGMTAAPVEKFASGLTPTSGSTL